MAKKKPTTEAGPRGRPKRTKPAAHGGGEVAVRMYKLVLGDCFLLTFPKDDGREFHLLIDCGLIQGAEGPEGVLKEVAADIKKRTKGVLDLVVITHEHWDHLSGFTQAREVFDDIEFKQLWVAWTEDSSNDLANELRAGRERRRKTLRQALQRLKADAAVATHPAVALAGALQAFSGDLEAAGDNKTADAFQWVKDHAGKRNTRYCKPGELLELPGVSAARVYVLGPPEDKALLHRSAPSARDKETYLASVEEQYRLALGLADEAGGDACAQPFDEPFRLGRDAARKDTFFQEHYGFGDGGEPWRRIDTDWQGLLGPLALQLDSDTNNTSLAMAIELLPGRKVLLFPGDAQVGNWLSWQDLSWADPDRRAGDKVTVKDLFARTVLYKVGHHGSHNATLRAQGLEEMTGDGLLAMIPVDEKFANSVKHWRMPWPDLLAGLQKRTGGRILRADQDSQQFDYATVGKLSIDLSIPLGPA
jgi:hypothetical protein